MNGTHGVLTNVGATFTYAGEADVRIEDGALILVRWSKGDGMTAEILGVWPLPAIVSYTCQDFAP